KDEYKSKALIQNSLDSAPCEELPNHLTLHPFQYKGLLNQIIDSKWIGLKIIELLFEQRTHRCLSYATRGSRKVGIGEHSSW
ncbi:hypothetical protein S245_052396, partial [Arachis hypogaea]